MRLPPRPTLPRGANRFAPTPTGDLHLGNARTALLAHLDARAHGLRTVLRVEDLDPATIPDGCLEGQYADLDWLGLDYDEHPRVGGPAGPYRQSERYADYRAVLDALDDLGLLYPCWCSRREVREAARAPHASDEGPVYAGTCKPAAPAPLGDLDALPRRRRRAPALRLDVTAALRRLGVERPAARGENRRRELRETLPAARREPAGVVESRRGASNAADGGGSRGAAGDSPRGLLDWTDALAGPQSVDMIATMGDFVVRRVDGIAAYQLACAWDDVAMGCTRVLRGADLIPSTARQLLILRTLGLPEPAYAHAGLVVDHAGHRLAKRDRSIALGALRAAGVPAARVVRLLATLSGLPDTADLDALTAAYAAGALAPGDVALPPDPLITSSASSA